MESFNIILLAPQIIIITRLQKAIKLTFGSTKVLSYLIINNV